MMPLGNKAQGLGSALFCVRRLLSAVIVGGHRPVAAKVLLWGTNPRGKQAVAAQWAVRVKLGFCWRGFMDVGNAVRRMEWLPPAKLGFGHHRSGAGFGSGTGFFWLCPSYVLKPEGRVMPGTR